MKKLIILIILLFAWPCWATDYYVRPHVTDGGCTYGSCDGTTYDNAWEGFDGGDGTPVNWATVDTGNGKLFVCGIVIEDGDPAVDIGVASGEDGTPIIITSCLIANGASVDDPGTIQLAANTDGNALISTSGNDFITLNGGLIIDANGANQTGGNIQAIIVNTGSNDIIIDGCTIKNSSRGGGTAGLYCIGCTNTDAVTNGNEITNNTIENCYYAGIRMHGGDSWTIDGNTISNVGSGIIWGLDADDIVVSNNTISNYAADYHGAYAIGCTDAYAWVGNSAQVNGNIITDPAYMVDAIDIYRSDDAGAGTVIVKVYDNIVTGNSDGPDVGIVVLNNDTTGGDTIELYRNTVVAAQKVGIETYGCDAPKIYLNYVEDFGDQQTGGIGAGIRMTTSAMDEFPTAPEIWGNVVYDGYNGIFIDGYNGKVIDALKLYNNTVRKCSQAGITFNDYVTNIDMQNNIVLDVGNYLVRVYANSTVTTMDYNQYYDGTYLWDWQGADDSTIADWRTATGDETNSNTGVPKLVSATDYHLLVSSPCIDAGANLTATVTTDIDGQSTTHANMAGNFAIGADFVYYLTILGGGTTLSYSLIDEENQPVVAVLIPPGATGCTIHDDGIPGTLDLDEQVGADTLGAELVSNPGFETAGGGGADVWASWGETASDGAIANEVVEVHGGADAAKLTQGASVATQLYSNGPVTVIGKLYEVSFWARGDGATAGQYSVGGNGIIQVTTGIPGAVYTKVINYFVATTTGSHRLYLKPGGTNGDIAYFDDISIKEVTSDTGIYNTWITTVDVAGLDATEPVLFRNCAFVESEAVIEAKNAVDVLFFDDECQFSINTTASFLDYAGANYGLPGGSSLRDAGEDTGADTDIDGRATPHGLHDIGPYEYYPTLGKGGMWDGISPFF